MSLNIPRSAILLLLLLLCSFTAISAHENEDPTIKTMEDFSGYPFHESHSTSQSHTVSLLSVDTQSLQKQVLHLINLIVANWGLSALSVWLIGFCLIVSYDCEILVCSFVHIWANFVDFWIGRLMNFRLIRIHLPHQLPGSCILRRMYWRVGLHVTFSVSNCPFN